MKEKSLLLTLSFVMSANTALCYFPPAGSWRTASPESQGMSTELLQQARSAMKTSTGEDYTSVTGIVIRNGYDIYHYGDPYGRKKQWASCTRSMFTAVWGMGISEGVITGGTGAVDRKVNSLGVPSCLYQDNGNYFNDSILVKHLLSYTSKANPPGSSWSYGVNYEPIQLIIGEIYGSTPASRLSALANAIDADWSSHNWHCSPCQPHDWDVLILDSNEADAARWAYLWLNGGNWDGIQVVDEWFVNRTLEPMPIPGGGGYASPDEGWQIHLNYGGKWGDIVPHDSFAAQGASGSVIFACPSLSLIFSVKTNPHFGDDYNIQNLLEPIVNAITSVDAGRPDTGLPDTNRTDTARPDISLPDTARPDATRPDSAPPDSTQPDATLQDVARADTARPDARLDAMEHPDVNLDDVAAPDLGSIDQSTGQDVITGLDNIAPESTSGRDRAGADTGLGLDTGNSTQDVSLVAAGCDCTAGHESGASSPALLCIVTLGAWVTRCHRRRGSKNPRSTASHCHDS